MQGENGNKVGNGSKSNGIENDPMSSPGREPPPPGSAVVQHAEEADGDCASADGC